MKGVTAPFASLAWDRPFAGIRRKAGRQPVGTCPTGL